VESANQAVYERNRQQQTVMGTTMTVALLIETTAYVAHVGDSRLYLYREPTGLAQLTHDHSVVAALVEAGIIAPDDIYTHPRRNQIYRSLGEEAPIEVDTATVPLAADDILLLCSDGLWEMVRDQQIAAILTASLPAPTDTAHALVQAALTGGGEDNVSAIVAQVSTI
jgi:serine/threonine protein phosphatase PrpC